VTNDPLESAIAQHPPAETAIAADTANDSTSDATGAVPGARASVRQSLLKLLALALVPLVVLGVARSTMQIVRNQAVVEARLSEGALETAFAQAEIIRTARVVLRLLADQADVRGAGPACDLQLAKVKRSFAAFSNLSRLGADAEFACSSAPAGPLASSPVPAWWPRVSREADFFVTGPVWGELSERQVLIAVQPIRTADGRPDGAITASIDLGWMQRSLESRGLAGDAVALVLDSSGRTLLGSRRVDFASLDVAMGPGRVADRSDSSGRRWTYAVAPLVGTSDGKQTLYLAYAMPEAQLFSAAWWQAGISLAQPLIAVLLASIVIWYGTNRLVLRWLRALRQMALAFTAGDYRAPAAEFDKAPAEFRDVAAAFYRMGQAVERRDGKLRTALDQQNQLVKEIHHRVKNNLQIVMSLISLQADRIETGAGRAALDQTRLRISALALVHRLLYETGEQSKMSAAELLRGVSSLVVQSFRNRPNVTLRAQFGDDELALDTAIPLALWLVDAMSNAWTHAFPDGRRGQVDVSLVRDGTDGILEVADNGIGFAVGASPTSTGRGLKILNGIGRQVGGRTEVTSTAGQGTIVRLRYPSGKAARSAVA